MLSVNATPQLSQRPQLRQSSQPAFKGAESYKAMHDILVIEMPKDIKGGKIAALNELSKLKEYLAKKMEAAGLKISEGNILKRLFGDPTEVKVLDAQNKNVGTLNLLADDGYQGALYKDVNGQNVVFQKDSSITGASTVAKPPLADDVLEGTVKRLSVHHSLDGHLIETHDSDAHGTTVVTKEFRRDGTLENSSKYGKTTYYKEDGITPIPENFYVRHSISL